MGTSLTNYDVTEDSLNLRDALDHILETVVVIYEAHNVPLPSRRYWKMGRPSEDCEQVVVSFLQMYLGAPGDQATTPQPCTGPRTAVFNISVSRNSEIGVNGKAHVPAKIMDAAAFSAVDVWVLMDALQAFNTWGDGMPGLGVIATVSAPEESGGLQTVNLNLTISIP